MYTNILIGEKNHVAIVYDGEIKEIKSKDGEFIVNIDSSKFSFLKNMNFEQQIALADFFVKCYDNGVKNTTVKIKNQILKNLFD